MRLHRHSVQYGIKRVPLFPFIPLISMALVVGSMITAIRALARVRRLERRFNRATA